MPLLRDLITMFQRVHPGEFVLLRTHGENGPAHTVCRDGVPPSMRAFLTRQSQGG